MINSQLLSEKFIPQCLFERLVNCSMLCMPWCKSFSSFSMAMISRRGQINQIRGSLFRTLGSLQFFHKQVLVNYWWRFYFVPAGLSNPIMFQVDCYFVCNSLFKRSIFKRATRVVLRTQRYGDCVYVTLQMKKKILIFKQDAVFPNYNKIILYLFHSRFLFMHKCKLFIVCSFQFFFQDANSGILTSHNI